MLKIENLNVSYGPIHALKGIHMEVNQGEIVTLIGSNGAGKSTTLSAITGMVKAQTGSINFFGKNITNIPPYKIVEQGISISPEGREVFPGLTVHENLRLGAYSRKDKGEINAAYDRVYELFPRLKERIGQTAGTLSGGEQQMLAIGRALMSQPKLLLLDEPSMGLAPNLVLMIFDLIESINKQGTTILLIEQNANMALSVADRAYVLETGNIVIEGKASDLARDERVKNAYLGGKGAAQKAQKRAGPSTEHAIHVNLRAAGVPAAPPESGGFRRIINNIQRRSKHEEDYQQSQQCGQRDAAGPRQGEPRSGLPGRGR